MPDGVSPPLARRAGVIRIDALAARRSAAKENT